MNASRRILASAGLALGDAAVLITLRPDGGALARDISAPHAWVAAAGPDSAAITLSAAGLWCVAAWLGVGLLATAASRLPGELGCIARVVSRSLLPAAVRRVLAGAAGLSVLVAPAAAGAR